jgi:co-chaperonin GroES (HSP10)
MLRPVNKHLVVRPAKQEQETPLVFVPDDYKEDADRYVFVDLVCAHSESSLFPGQKLLIHAHLMDEVTCDGKLFHIIPENSVIAFVDSDL